MKSIPAPYGFFELHIASFEKTANTIRNAFRSYFAHFELAYSIKANHHPDLLQACVKQGILLEVSSAQEYERAIRANGAKSDVLVNAPFLYNEWLQHLDSNGAQVYFQSRNQLKQIPKGLKRNAIGLRFNLGDDVNNSSRFGLNLQKDHDVIFDAIQKCNAQRVHVHSRDWTSERLPSSYFERSKWLLEICQSLQSKVEIASVNLGGGFLSDMPLELRGQFTTKSFDWNG